MSLKVKIILILLLVAFIPPFFVSAFSFFVTKSTLEKSAADKLSLLAEFYEGEVLLYLEHLKSRTRHLASDGFIREALADLVLKSPPHRLPELKKYLQEQNKVDEHFTGMEIRSPEGSLVVSTLDDSSGPVDFKGYVEFDGESSGMVDRVAASGRRELAVFHPVFDLLDPAKRLGMLIAYYEVGELTRVLSGDHVRGLGAMTQFRRRDETGEVYLVNAAGFPLTTLRFLNESPVKSLNEKPIWSCLDQGEETAGTWMDYRAKQVVGASMCIRYEGLDWVLISKQDRHEVLLPILRLGFVLFSVGFMAQFIFAVIGFFLARRITMPILNLANTAQAVAAGKLDLRAEGWDRKDEIGVLAKSFNTMTGNLVSANRKLELLDKRKSEFVSIVAHEFKNPLGIILMSAENLLSGMAGQLNEAQKKMAEITLRTARRMLRLAVSMLDLDRIESGKVELNRTDLDFTRLLREVLDETGPVFQSGDLCLKTDDVKDGVRLVGDEDRLKQVLLNLVGNALKYTPQKGVIEVCLGEDLVDVYLRISNSGPGISREDLGKLFDRFERFSAEKKEGTGLGLPIAKSIVELHRGKIQVESEPGGMTSFLVTLPKK